MKRPNKATIKTVLQQIWITPKWFILCSIATSLLLAVIAEFGVFNNSLVVDAPYYSWRRYSITALLCFGFIILCKYHKYLSQNLDKAFLLICSTAGLSFIFAFPQVVHVSPDDHIHMRNAFVFLHDEAHWSDGIKMLDAAIDTDTSGMSMSEIDEVHKKMNDAHADTRDKVMTFTDSYNWYSRLVYLPYHLGFEVSQFIGLNLTSMLIIAKLFNYICYVLLFYFAIKLSTHARKIFFAIGLISSNIFYATQFSYDPMITASIMLALALFLRMLSQEKIDSRYLFGFVLLVVWASLPKAVYCPLLLLLLILPSKKFDSRKRAIIFKMLIIILTLILLSSFVLPALTGGMTGDVRGGNTSVSGQIHFILSHPLSSIKTILGFTIMCLPSLAFGQNALVNFPVISGSIFSNQVIYVTQVTYYMELILIFWAVFTTAWPKSIISHFRKVYFATIYVIITMAIISAMYLSFTAVGNDTVLGVQARYFIPILPLLLLLIAPTRERAVDLSPRNPIPLFCWYVCLVALVLFFFARVSFIA